jgi:hemoglobin
MMTISEAVSAKPSLYDRLGGVYNIATVVEDLIDRIMVDARLNANPRVDEAHHKVPPAGFKHLVTEPEVIAISRWDASMLRPE